MAGTISGFDDLVGAVQNNTESISNLTTSVSNRVKTSGDQTISGNLTIGESGLSLSGKIKITPPQQSDSSVEVYTPVNLSDNTVQSGTNYGGVKFRDATGSYAGRCAMFQDNSTRGMTLYVKNIENHSAGEFSIVLNETTGKRTIKVGADCVDNSSTVLANAGFQGGNYVDNPFGATFSSGATYTAPASGFLQVNFSGMSDGEYVKLTAGGLSTMIAEVGGSAVGYIHVAKGNSVEIIFSGTPTGKSCKFMYAAQISAAFA